MGQQPRDCFAKATSSYPLQPPRKKQPQNPTKTHPSTQETTSGAEGRCHGSFTVQHAFSLFCWNQWNTEIGETEPSQLEATGQNPRSVLQGWPACAASQRAPGTAHPGNPSLAPSPSPAEAAPARLRDHRRSRVRPSKEGLTETTPLPLQLRQTFSKKSLWGHCFCPVFQYIKCNYFIVDLPVIRGMCLNMIYWVSFVPVDLQ